MYHTADYMSLSHGCMVIRIAQGSLSFAKFGQKQTDKIIYEPYEMNGSISMAANMREAFRTSEVLQSSEGRPMVLVDSNNLLIPEDEFDAEQINLLYEHTFASTDAEVKLFDELPELSVNVVYALNRDLRNVIEDHFSDVQYAALCLPVWKYFHQRNYNGPHKKLFAYFHDKKLEVFAFVQNRFKFSNSYMVSHVNDALYFLLYVWEQLAFDQEQDELFIAGDSPNEEWLATQLRRYVQRVCFVPSESETVPYDICLLHEDVLKS